MTGSVIAFPPRSPEPTFLGLPDALRWYEAKGLRATKQPPVDATGDDGADMYLCILFNGLLHEKTLTGRLVRLHEKATEQERHRAHLDREGEPGSEGHALMRDIILRWGNQLSEAVTAPAAGGAA